MEDFEALVSEVPNYERYMSVGELDSKFDKIPDRSPGASLIPLGKTKGGRSLRALKIGKGRHNALIYAFPNPEEPLGGLVIDSLISLLVKHNASVGLDYTWYFIACIDPDGASLTDGFVKGPLTTDTFVRNYYRTPVFDTGEENFPYRYGSMLDLNKPTPETLALMKLMSGRRFDFISSLHVMKFGGITYQVAEPCPVLYPRLQRCAKMNGIFMRKRPGDMLAEGVQLAGYFTPATNYVRAHALGDSPTQEVTGAYVYEFARLLNPRMFMMVPECCMWFDPRCADDSPSGVTLKESLGNASKSAAPASKLLVDTYKTVKPLLSEASPFAGMVGDVVDAIVNPKANILDPDPVLTTKDLESKIPVSKKISIEGRADLYRMFNLGAALRMVEHQVEKGGNKPQLSKARGALEEAISGYNDYLKADYKMIHHPLKNLVSMNMGSLLFAAEYAAERNTPPYLWH